MTIMYPSTLVRTGTLGLCLEQCVVRWGIPGNFTVRKNYFLNCSKHLRDTLDKVRNKWRIFLAYDLGTFG